VRFINEHKNMSGIELLRADRGRGVGRAEHLLRRGEQAAAAREPSATASPKTQISRVHEENREVYGAGKVWLEHNR